MYFSLIYILKILVFLKVSHDLKSFIFNKMGLQLLLSYECMDLYSFQRRSLVHHRQCGAGGGCPSADRTPGLKLGISFRRKISSLSSLLGNYKVLVLLYLILLELYFFSHEEKM